MFYLVLLLEFLYNVYCALSHPVEWVIVRVGNVKMLSKRSRYLLADVACGPGLAPPQRGQLGDVGILGFGSWRLFP
ncbi:unnamed protein product [Absidia cylindrospora]